MGLASDFPSVHTVRSSVEFSTWFRCSTTGERRSPSSSKPSPNATMISPIDTRKVGGNCRPKFALALVVALVCAVAEASRYKSYEPEPSYGGHYEEDDYGSYEDHDSYETIGGGYKGSHYEQYSKSKSYKQQPSYGGQDYKKSYRHKRAIIPVVMPRRKIEEGLKMFQDMRKTVAKLKTDTATDAVALLNKQIEGASNLFQRMLGALQTKIE